MRMTHHARILLALAVLASGFARVKADGPDHFRVTDVAVNDVLNLRAAPKAPPRTQHIIQL